MPSSPTALATRATKMGALPLAALVRRLAVDRASWVPLVEHHPHRWWSKLVTSDQVDAWLITWPRDLATELHDHGSSWAAFTVVQGSLDEYTPNPNGSLARRRLSRGPVALVPPKDVHDVVNTSATPAVSIHAYSPPLLSMTYFHQQEARLVPTRTELRDESSRWLEP